MSKFVKGGQGVKSLIGSFAQKQNLIIKREVEIVGRQLEHRAKEDVVVDFGKLRQSIRYERTKAGYGARVTAGVNYAPYVEFGTGGLVDVPKGYEEMAMQFKGKGIRQVNLKARPFLIPNAKRARIELIARLKALGLK